MRKKTPEPIPPAIQAFLDGIELGTRRQREIRLAFEAAPRPPKGVSSSDTLPAPPAKPVEPPLEKPAPTLGEEIAAELDAIFAGI